MQSCFGGQMPQLSLAKRIKNKELQPYQPSDNVDILGYDLQVDVSNGSSSQVQERCLRLIMPEVQYTDALRSHAVWK